MTVTSTNMPPSYKGPINTCPQCGTPTSGVLCTPCATK
jgi:hypothetical protein